MRRRRAADNALEDGRAGRRRDIRAVDLPPKLTAPRPGVAKRRAAHPPREMLDDRNIEAVEPGELDEEVDRLPPLACEFGADEALPELERERERIGALGTLVREPGQVFPFREELVGAGTGKGLGEQGAVPRLNGDHFRPDRHKERLLNRPRLPRPDDAAREEIDERPRPFVDGEDAERGR